MALHFTSTTATEEEMRQDLAGDDVQPVEAEDTPVGAVSLRSDGAASDEGEGDEADTPADEPAKAASQPTADDKAAPDKKADAGAKPAEKTSTDEEDLSDLPARAQKRIGQYRKRLGDAERTQAALQERLTQLEGKLAAAGKPAEEKPATDKTPAAAPETPAPASGEDPTDPEPQLEDQDIVDVADYEKKHRAWDDRRIERKVQAILAQERTAREKADAEKRAADEEREAQAALDTRVNAFKATHPDYNEVVGTTTFRSQAVIGAIVTDEKGPDLAYHLASNPEELTRLEKLPIARQFMEMGKLLAGLESGGAPAAGGEKPAPSPPKPRVSNAPKPIAGVGGVSTATAHEVTDDSSYKDDERRWENDMKGQIARR